MEEKYTWNMSYRILQNNLKNSLYWTFSTVNGIIFGGRGVKFCSDKEQNSGGKKEFCFVLDHRKRKSRDTE